MTSNGLSWSEAVAGLRLGGAVVGDTGVMELQNVGETPVAALSHVDVGEIHLDWFSVLLKQSDAQRVLRFVADRDESVLQWAHLNVGERVRHEVNLALWAMRPINGGQPLAAGWFTVSFEYSVERATVDSFGGASDGEATWAGALTTPAFAWHR